jgi:hypothetical protein
MVMAMALRWRVAIAMPAELVRQPASVNSRGRVLVGAI